MNGYEALEVCPDMAFVHVATIMDTDNNNQQPQAMKRTNNSASDQILKLDQYIDEECGQTILPSNVCNVKILSTNTNLPVIRRFKIETGRDKESMKVSLAPYREESKKIFAILKRFSPNVEKASCDEAFIDVTNQVNMKFEI